MKMIITNCVNRQDVIASPAFGRDEAILLFRKLPLKMQRVLLPDFHRNDDQLLRTMVYGLWTMVFLFVWQSAFSQEMVFRATFSKNRVVMNETFQITFTLENADGKNFTPPAFNDFYKVGGPNQSTNMQFINGSMSRSVSYSYFLQPKKEGTFTISPATIEVQGRSLKTNSVTVEVVKSGVSAGSGAQQREPSIGEQVAENVFVRVVLDKDECYQGEQITATYKLYTRMQIGNVNFSKMPQFNGFWTQELENVQNIQFTKEVYKGVQFDVATLKKVAMFPQRSGDLELEPLELETVVRVQVKNQYRNIWDDFFGSYKDVPHHMVSNKAKIKVNPLPAANKPHDFSGVVGNFKMDVKLDKTETNVDDPITLSIKISGDGNVKLLEKPAFELPKDFDVFDPKTNENVTKRGNTVTGHKTYDYLLIPRRPGEFKVPSFSFNYFDLNKKDYVRLNSPEYTIKVTGQASASSTQSITGIKKEEVELLGEDIRFIHTSATFKEKDKRFFGTTTFAGLFVAPFILFLGLFVYKKRDDELKGNKTLLKKMQAGKAAAKRMTEAKKALQAGDKKKFYDETAKALWGYMGDKLNIDASQLSKENVSTALQQKNVPPETVKKFFSIIDDCEMALYAPSLAGSNMSKTFESASAVINEMEESLK
jgi:hypothetical protein